MALTQENQAQGAENPPTSLVPSFNADELALIFGMYLPDAAFVLECEQAKLVAANQQLVKLLDLSASELDAGNMVFDKIVHAQDRSAFHTWMSATGGTFASYSQESFEVRLVSSDGREIPSNVVLKHLRWKQHDYLIGFVRDISAQREQEARLNREIQEQKRRAFEAIKSSLCIYQFNEKIKSTPVLTTRLLDVEDEQELFKEAAAVMTSEQGFNYSAVTFVLLEDSVLRIAYSTRQWEQTVFPLGDDNRFSRFIRTSYKSPEDGGGDILVPLKSSGRLIGLCEITPYARERSFFDESGRVGEWQKDVLLTIGDIIALLLDNLRLAREIKHQSNTDMLTGTYNRHYFVGRLSSEMQRSGRYGRPMSMLFIDVDKFKSINDTHGHVVGDQVLRDLGKLFVDNLRTTDVICRYGGDEFVALLPETGEETAQEAAQKLLEAVRSYELTDPDDRSQAVRVAVSIGMSTLRPGESEDAFIKAADDALYRAKEGGRDRVFVG